MSALNRSKTLRSNDAYTRKTPLFGINITYNHINTPTLHITHINPKMFEEGRVSKKSI